MNLLEKLDDTVLDVCTRFAHAVQRLTGYTSRFIAKVGVLISTISMTLHVVNYFHRILWHRTDVFLLSISVMLIFGAFMRIHNLDRADDQQLSEEIAEVEGGTGKDNWLYRLVFLFATILVTLVSSSIIGFLGKIDDLSFVWGLTIFHYFVAVEPLRPGKSKIRQWIEKLSFSSAEPARVGSRS